MIEIAIGTAGLIIAWFTFKKTFYSQPVEEKQNLIALFLATQTLSKDVSRRLFDYTSKHNAFEMDLLPGITYRKYLAALEESNRQIYLITGLSNLRICSSQKAT